MKEQEGGKNIWKSMENETEQYRNGRVRVVTESMRIFTGIVEL